PFCLDEPEVPTANGPSSRLRCSRGSQLGNRSMSVQADHVAAASAWMTAATSSSYFMLAPFRRLSSRRLYLSSRRQVKIRREPPVLSGNRPLDSAPAERGQDGGDGHDRRQGVEGRAQPFREDRREWTVQPGRADEDRERRAAR